MAHPEHLDLLKQGVATWNRWYKEHYWTTTPDLRGADLSHMDLRDVRLNFARLQGASFRASNLQRASFIKSSLGHADLSYADLRQANFRDALLGSANLSHADLEEARLDSARLLDANLHKTRLNAAKIRRASLVRANLSEANLQRVDLEGTHCNRTDLRSVDFSFARIGKNTWINVDFSFSHGLESVVHTAAAFRLDMRTLFRSQRHCPEPFLRALGFSEQDMLSLQSVDSGSLVFPTCLLSYANEDHMFAEQLLRDLRARGVLCQAQTYESTTAKSIATHDKLLLLISTASPPSWNGSILSSLLKEARVKAYWEALGWETSGILCPISLDDTFQTKIADWPPSYRRPMLSSSNFSGWGNQNNYEQALHRFFEQLCSAFPNSNETTGSAPVK
jgi:hypothetical protein